MDPKIIGNRIKLLIANKNMKTNQLAKELGISHSTLIKKLDGEREFCNTEIVRLTEIFNLDVNLCANIFFNPDFNLEEKINKEEKIS